MNTETEAPNPNHPDNLTCVLRWVVKGLLGAIVVAAALVGLVYIASPAAIRNPTGTHYHFRLQIISGGKPVNFADKAFQTPLNHDICTAKLTNEPIHFHDNLDQFVHIHWAHISGGVFLKNYGWNFIGGLPDSLGYRFDKSPKLINVPIHGYTLPNAPNDANYYIYTGDASSYQERNWHDFLKQDLNVFFGHPTVSKAQGGFGSWLIPGAAAQADMSGMNMSSSTGTAQTEAQLTELNHVVGNAVIFVQKNRPTDQQIKDRFAHLVPLPESTCGG